MTSIGALWLAILVSSVLVFLASSVIHMASPWHKSDFPRYGRESDILDALRPLALPPGDYFMPRPSSMSEMKSPGFVETMNRGPVVLMTVFPNGVMPTTYGKDLKPTQLAALVKYLSTVTKKSP